MEKVLHLTLKKKWFDLIASGEKKEEYREDKPHWQKRFFNHFGDQKEYDVIVFSHGYAENAPRMIIEYKGLEFRTGRPEWGAERGEMYYVLKLGKIISKNF